VFRDGDDEYERIGKETASNGYFSFEDFPADLLQRSLLLDNLLHAAYKE
jgi:hypothetical protein